MHVRMQDMGACITKVMSRVISPELSLKVRQACGVTASSDMSAECLGPLIHFCGSASGPHVVHSCAHADGRHGRGRGHSRSRRNATRASPTVLSITLCRFIY